MRTAGAVLLGYLAMAALVMAGLTVAYLAMGADAAFRPGSYDVSAVWIVVSLAVGLVAALLGGWVARRVGRTPTAPRALAALVLALGLLLALPALFGSGERAAGARAGAPGAMEAMGLAHTPPWILLVNPLLGAAGVLAGGGVLRRR
jgi:hypothetical protein